MLEFASNKAYLEGCKKIHNQVHTMTMEDDLTAWSVSQEQQINAEKSETLGNFREENITNCLNHVYANQCSTSLESFLKTYRYLVFSRYQYLLLMMTYLQYSVERKLKADLNYNVWKLAYDQIINFSSDVELINQVAGEILEFFHEVKVAPVEWQACLGKLSNCKDIQ